MIDNHKVGLMRRHRYTYWLFRRIYLRKYTSVVSLNEIKQAKNLYRDSVREVADQLGIEPPCEGRWRLITEVRHPTLGKYLEPIYPEELK